MTYSDLLVSLLVVFALLLLLALAHLDRQRRIADANKEAVRSTIEMSSRAMRAAADAMQRSADVGESSGASTSAFAVGSGVEFDARTQTLTVRDEVLFDFGSDRLRPEGTALVASIGARFVPRLLADSVLNRNIDAIVVEGHTDSVGSYLSNLELSQRRAQRVLKTLVEGTYGLPYASRLRELLVASGRSEIEALRAADEGKYDANRARRIVLRIRLRNEDLLRRLLGENPISIPAP